MVYGYNFHDKIKNYETNNDNLDGGLLNYLNYPCSVHCIMYMNHYIDEQ